MSRQISSAPISSARPSAQMLPPARPALARSSVFRAPPPNMQVFGAGRQGPVRPEVAIARKNFAKDPTGAFMKFAEIMDPGHQGDGVYLWCLLHEVVLYSDPYVVNYQINTHFNELKAKNDPAVKDFVIGAQLFNAIYHAGGYLDEPTPETANGKPTGLFGQFAPPPGRKTEQNATGFVSPKPAGTPGFPMALCREDSTESNLFSSPTLPAQSKREVESKFFGAQTYDLSKTPDTFAQHSTGIHRTPSITSSSSPNKMEIDSPIAKMQKGRGVGRKLDFGR